MTIWLDAQLSPALATWISETLDVTCKAVRELGLHDAADGQIFEAARAAAAVVMTKDADFVRLLERHGPPPHVLWVTCGMCVMASRHQVSLVVVTRDHLAHTLDGHMPSADQPVGRPDVCGRGHHQNTTFWNTPRVGES